MRFYFTLFIAFLCFQGCTTTFHDEDFFTPVNKEGNTSDNSTRNSLSLTENIYPYSFDEDKEYIKTSLGYDVSDLFEKEGCYYLDNCHLEIPKETLSAMRLQDNINGSSTIGYDYKFEKILAEDCRVIDIHMNLAEITSQSDRESITKWVKAAIEKWNSINDCALMFFLEKGNIHDNVKDAYLIFEKGQFGNFSGEIDLETITIKDEHFPNDVKVNIDHESWAILKDKQKEFFMMHLIGHMVGMKDITSDNDLYFDDSIMESHRRISQTNSEIWNGFSEKDLLNLKEKYFGQDPSLSLTYARSPYPESSLSESHLYKKGEIYQLMIEYRDDYQTDVDINYFVYSRSEIVNELDCYTSYNSLERLLDLGFYNSGDYTLSIVASTGSLEEGNYIVHASLDQKIKVIGEIGITVQFSEKKPIGTFDGYPLIESGETYSLKISEVNDLDCFLVCTLASQDTILMCEETIQSGQEIEFTTPYPLKHYLFIDLYYGNECLKRFKTYFYAWKRPELSFEWEREPVKSFMTPIEGAGVLDYQEAHEFYLDVNKVYPVHINYVNENYPGEVLRLSYTTEYINPSYEKCMPNQAAAMDVDSDFPEDMEQGDTPVGGDTTVSYLPSEDGIPLDYNYNILLPIQPGVRKLNFTVKKVSDEEVVDNFHIYIYGLADGFYHAPQNFEIGNSYNCKYTYGHPEHPNATVTQIMTEPVFNHPLRFGNQWDIVPITEHGAWFVTATVKENGATIKREVLALVDLPNSPRTSQIEIRMEEAEPTTPDIVDSVAYENYILHYTINFESGGPFIGFVATEKETRTFSPIIRRVDRQWEDGDPVLVKYTSSSAGSVVLPSTSVMYTNAPFVQEFHYYTRKIFWPKNGVHLLNNPNVSDLPMHEGHVEVIGDNGLSDVRNRPL